AEGLTYCAGAEAHAALEGTHGWTINGDTEDCPPAAPTGLTAEPGDTEVLLTWAANSETDLDSYTIHGGTATNPTDVVGTVSGTTFTHTGLTNGTAYYYRITATDIAGNESDPSDEATAQIGRASCRERA